MFASRFLQLTFSALALALFALVGQAIPMQAAAGAAASDAAVTAAAPPYLIYMPMVAKEIPVTGRLISSGSPVSGQRVVLSYTTDGWASYQEFASTTTDADGFFTLRMPPLLNSQQRYQVYWVNTSSNASWLRSFYSNVGTSQTASHHYEMEIANVRLVSPTSGATVSLPTTFIWQKRNISGDRYGVMLANAGLTRTSGQNQLYDADRSTFTRLPDWVTANNKHYWYVTVQTPAGFGYSYWMHEITWRSLSLSSPLLNSQAAEGQPQLEWQENSLLPAGPPALLPQPLPAE